ncbi:retroviral-like aspartic protease family protein [Altericista sp. CCNU0014]|uniref:retroviral-like aspartic protease family protein n=1 Tax=Altericista sp. CCNU0014 TaxID=3082949 RepID=UPI00385082EF
MKRLKRRAMSLLPGTGWLYALLVWTIGGSIAPSRAVPQPVTTTRAIVQLQGLEVPAPRVKGTATVPIKMLEKTQVYTAAVTVGKLSRPFLVDTGASTTLLSAGLVNELKLPGRAVPSDRLASAVAGNECSTMKATLHELPPLTLQSLEIRGVTGLRFEKAAVPDGLAGAMGMDVLRQFDLKFNPKAKMLAFLPTSVLPTASSAAAIPLQKKLGVFLAKLTLDGRGPFTVLLDTGADSTFISQEVAQQLSLRNRQPIQVLGFCGLESAEKSQLASAKLLQYEQKNIEAIILSSPILKLLGVDGILGQNFLGQYQQHWRFVPSIINGVKADGSLLLSPQ